MGAMYASYTAINNSYSQVVKQVDNSAYDLTILQLTSNLNVNYAGTYYQAISKNGKVYIIESNAQPGVPFDSTVEAYKHIYEDFYKKPLDEQSLTKLDEYAKTMVEKTLKKDGGKRFSIK